MYLCIYIVHGYERMCIYLFNLFGFTKGVIKFIVIVLIWISTALYFSYYHTILLLFIMGKILMILMLNFPPGLLLFDNNIIVYHI